MIFWLDTENLTTKKAKDTLLIRKARIHWGKTRQDMQSSTFETITFFWFGKRLIVKLFFSASHTNVQNAIEGKKKSIQKGDQYIAWGEETVLVLVPEEFEQFILSLKKGEAK